MMTSVLRVLYVDDEKDLLKISKLFLEGSGDFTVTTSLSAPEAIRLLEQEKTMLSRQIEATDGAIDKLVCELHGLTEEKIAIVEGNKPS